ncbi:MAG: KH domain-containing protein [Bacteroidota bacterium]|nr:KH domain-containing protein [Bacteroidota bacterium]
MKEFLEYVAKQLVDQPEEVSIQEETIENQLVLKLKVAQPDVGKVIGKKGKTVLALRTLISAIGKKSGNVVKLELVVDQLKGKN